MMKRAIIRRESDVALVSSTGATLTQWMIDDEDIIYPFHKNGTKQRGGIPICCPFFGPTPQGFEGIPQHGWLRNTQVDQFIETDNRRMESRGANYRPGYKIHTDSYPWSLLCSVNHFLNNAGLLTSLRVEHLVNPEIGQVAPINIAFHPYFKSHGKGDVYINGRKKPMSAFYYDARHVIIKGDDEIIIDTGKYKIRMSLTGFRYDTCSLYLWSDSSDYFCVEPVLTFPSFFNEKNGAWIKQGTSIDVAMLLTIE